MNYENILIELENNIAILTINRPSKLNALNIDTINDLHKAIKTLGKNKRNSKVILITGSGEKAFVAGADISEFAHFTIAEGAQLASEGQEKLFDLIENLKTPVIAAINGFAFGWWIRIGYVLSFQSCFRQCQNGTSRVSLGVIPGYGGTQRLPQLIGKGRAMELIMTASMIDAETAKIMVCEPCSASSRIVGFYQRNRSKNHEKLSFAIGRAIKFINANYKDGKNGFETEIKKLW